MKYKVIKSAAHNFGHSFVSLRLCPDWCGKEKWRILPED